MEGYGPFLFQIISKIFLNAYILEYLFGHFAGLLQVQQSLNV
jgi:hypothetical protein